MTSPGERSKIKVQEKGGDHEIEKRAPNEGEKEAALDRSETDADTKRDLARSRRHDDVLNVRNAMPLYPVVIPSPQTP